MCQPQGGQAHSKVGSGTLLSKAERAKIPTKGKCKQSNMAKTGSPIELFVQIQGSVELCHSLCKKAGDTGQLNAVGP